MKPIKPHFPTAGLAVCLVIALSCGCQRDTHSKADALPGYLEADLIEIASPSAGYLETLSVRRGQQVDKNAPLFRIDTSELDYNLEAAKSRHLAAQQRAADANRGEREETIRRLQANLTAAQAASAFARAEYARNHELIKTNAVSQSVLDLSESQMKQSAEQVRALEAELELARQGQRPLQIESLTSEASALDATERDAAWLRGKAARNAPETAIVQDTLYEPGEWIAAGRPVVVLRRISDLRARFYVTPQRLASLKNGDRVEVMLPDSSSPLPATVTRISDQAEYTPPVIYSREESERLVFLVEALLQPGDAARLHPGLPITVRIPPPAHP